MSLKTQLKQIILERGVVTLKEIEDYCHKAQYKLSNAERRLRELRGIVEPIYNEKKTAIIAYKKHEANQTREEGADQPNPPDIRDTGWQVPPMQPTTISGFAHISERKIPENGVRTEQHNRTLLELPF